jgi:hypothetical protein
VRPLAKTQSHERGAEVGEASAEMPSP